MHAHWNFPLPGGGGSADVPSLRVPGVLEIRNGLPEFEGGHCSCFGRC